MPILFERTVRHRGIEYRIKADLDDAAIVEDQLRLAVAGAARRRPEESWFEVTVELTVDFRKSQIVGRVGDQHFVVPLNLALSDAKDFTGNDIDVVADDKQVDQAIKDSFLNNESNIGDLMQLIPTDPILGCIVKGAVSTVVGQTIRCWRSTPSAAPMRERIDRVASCLKDYGVRMALTFMFRTGKCIALFGLV